MHAVLAMSAAASVLAAVTAGTANSAGNPATATGGTAPPPLTILTPDADNGNDNIFIAPSGGGYAEGPEIVTAAGKVVWFHALPTGDYAQDFRTQTYQGQPVLTWFENGGDGGPRGVIDNDQYRQIATVRAGNGYVMDDHEFQITPWNTALIVADGVTTANLTSVGGPADQQVFVNVVQEIDIASGKVLFQWNPADYVPYSDSHAPVPSSASQGWDWFHMNSVHVDADGNLLVNSRHTWTVYKVNHSTGQVMWELGGRQSSFALRAASGQVLDSAGAIFAWQHDAEGLGDGRYTVFDNESAGTPLLPYSRAVTMDLNLQTRVATLVKSFNQPEGLSAYFLGNVQTLRNGDSFVSWGDQPYMAEFGPFGKLLFNAELPSGVFTYRAYLLPWPPGPPERDRVNEEPSTPQSSPHGSCHRTEELRYDSGTTADFTNTTREAWNGNDSVQEGRASHQRDRTREEAALLLRPDPAGCEDTGLRLRRRVGREMGQGTGMGRYHGSRSHAAGGRRRRHP
jgi:Arylsulfotransferase (ASST)